MVTSALLPFHPTYARRILAGIKILEVRRRQLDKWRWIYVYETGGEKLIVGRFEIIAIDPYSPAHREDATLTVDTEKQYAGAGTWSHSIGDVVRFDNPVKWWRPAPQSVWSLTEAEVERIELTANTTQETLW